MSKKGKSLGENTACGETLNLKTHLGTQGWRSAQTVWQGRWRGGPGKPGREELSRRSWRQGELWVVCEGGK